MKSVASIVATKESEPWKWTLEDGTTIFHHVWIKDMFMLFLNGTYVILLQNVLKT